MPSQVKEDAEEIMVSFADVAGEQFLTRESRSSVVGAFIYF